MTNSLLAKFVIIVYLYSLLKLKCHEDTILRIEMNQSGCALYLFGKFQLGCNNVI